MIGEGGREFERQVAAMSGAELVPGSGNQWWAKLDLSAAGKLLLSLKWTGKDAFIVSPRLIAEIEEAVHGPGGVGGDTVGGLVYSVGGKVRIDLDLLDFLRMHEEKVVIGRQTKSDARREKASKPILLRDET